MPILSMFVERLALRNFIMPPVEFYGFKPTGHSQPRWFYTLERWSLKPASACGDVSDFSKAFDSVGKHRSIY